MIDPSSLLDLFFLLIFFSFLSIKSIHCCRVLPPHQPIIIMFRRVLSTAFTHAVRTHGRVGRITSSGKMENTEMEGIVLMSLLLLF